MPVSITKHALVLGMALLLVSCMREGGPASTAYLIEKAITAPLDGPEQVAALKTLERCGKPIAIPSAIWLQGPSSVEIKGATEDLEGMKGTRLVQVDGIHYICSGHLEGKSYISLLAVRSYPDGKLRFVFLAEAIVRGND